MAIRYEARARVKFFGKPFANEADCILMDFEVTCTRVVKNRHCNANISRMQSV